MGMTMVEKILARASGRPAVHAGDTVVAKVDMNILIDLMFTQWPDPLRIADAERTVLTGPFRPFPRSIMHGELSLFPKPPWFVTARSALDTGKALTSYGSEPRWLGLPGIFAAAFRA